MQSDYSNSPPVRSTDPAPALATQIRSARPGEPVRAKLRVDDRVLARVTDGIYRRPSAALRELVFNAYDADATTVVIDTDAPRYQRMSVRDNGIGMDYLSLADLIEHIGGSSKRTWRGVDIGTTNSADPDLSPSGRPLIGKIGIGLFAVVHLTTNFRIITKRKGSEYRLVADVHMKTHTEEARMRKRPAHGAKEEFVAGDVSIVREPASDAETQGTEVVLLELRKTTRDILRDAERWHSILAERKTGESGSHQQLAEQASYRLDPPTFHAGFLAAGDPGAYEIEPVLPWDIHADPAEKFSQLYERLVRTTGTTQKNPDLERVFDQYLETLWRLSLAAPLPYLREHPLAVRSGSGIELFHLENKSRSRAKVLDIGRGETVAEALGLESVRDDPCGGFSVLIDGVELHRPVVLSPKLIETGRASRVRQRSPMLFVGKCRTPLGNYDPERSGGPLEFEAYFYWNTLIVPNQNRGVLVRVHGASGVLYDEKFMDFQTAELNRLKQITAEVFILKGMDPALNIDRESFNVSHPHYQYLAKWVHAAIRQITNLLKESGKKGLVAERTARTTEALRMLDERVGKVWQRHGDELQDPPQIVLLRAGESQTEFELRSGGGVAFHLPADELASASSPGSAAPPAAAEQAKAVMTVLFAHGLLEDIPYHRQQQIFEDIVQILTAGRD
jgi:hypothetical protein